MARDAIKGSLLGQLLALLIAVTAVCSASLAGQGLSAPTLQSSLNYLLLAAVYLTLHVRRHGWRLKCKWYAYALLALLDVEGNFCLVMAYRYTSLTSVTLLDSFTIPMVVALSAGLLGATYRRGHYAGAALCLAGLLLLVLTDRSGGGGSGGAPNPLLGDALVLLGATLYALCNVLQELLLGDVVVHELLGMLGLWGCLWSAAQGMPLELDALRAAAWSPAAAAPFLGFGLAMFLFYSLVPFELRWGGAALLNISLLASDLWAALARYLYFGGFPGSSLLFFLAALAVVAAGILLFTWSGDVDTALGAGSGRVEPSSALPVAYQPVPGHERRPLAGLSSKDAAEALRQVHLEQQLGQGGAAHGGANPFDLSRTLGKAAARGGGTAGGFVPLPAADDAWPEAAAATAGGSDTPASPAALGMSAPAGPVGPVDAGRRPPSLELQRSPTLGSL